MFSLTVLAAKVSNFTAIELLFTDPSLTTLGLIPGTAFITGWLLIAFLIVLLTGAMSCVRDSGHFQVSEVDPFSATFRGSFTLPSTE